MDVTVDAGAVAPPPGPVSDDPPGVLPGAGRESRTLVASVTAHRCTVGR